MEESNQIDLKLVQQGENMAGQYLKRKVLKKRKEIEEKWRKAIFKLYGKLVCLRIKDQSFTIISNNCWAGRIYQFLGLPYNSPTIGLYFFADDYLKFVSDLRYYLGLDLKFISGRESKFADELEKRNQLEKVIGVLGDVEIVFLHYHSQSEAKEKWKRRGQRVNFQNILIKFSQMNGCKQEHLEKFEQLNHENKFVFMCNANSNIQSGIYYPGFENQREILNDTDSVPKGIRLVSYLNRRVAYKDGFKVR